MNKMVDDVTGATAIGTAELDRVVGEASGTPQDPPVGDPAEPAPPTDPAPTPPEQEPVQQVAQAVEPYCCSAHRSGLITR